MTDLVNRKKVLVITYYWPPAGGIGVHRCLKFVKYLRKYGWEPIVYAPQNAQYPYFDDGNFKDIPENLTTIKRPIVEPFNMFKILSGRGKESSLSNPLFVRDKKKKFVDELAIWIRGNFFIPDARALWIRPSVKYLSEYIKQNNIDAIFSDGPPHTNTVIACKLSKTFGIPWLADFQDPWTQVDYYEHFKLTNWADKRHKKMEQDVFRTAKKITIASPSWKNDIETIGAKNVDVLYWGYDEDDFVNINKSGNDKFTITHSGLLGLDRSPETFLRVIKKLIEENSIFKEKVLLKLIGMVDYSIIEIINNLNLNDYVFMPGNVSRNESLKHLSDSSILLLPLNKAKNAKGRIPGKLFECLRMNIPVLCLGRKDSDSAYIIESTKRGKVFEYDDSLAIEKYVIYLFDLYLKGNKTDSEIDISEYSVDNQTKKLADYLNEIIEEK